MGVAANWVGLGILYNTGQDCTAGSRLFVQDTIYDKFIAVGGVECLGIRVKLNDKLLADCRGEVQADEDRRWLRRGVGWRPRRKLSGLSSPERWLTMLLQVSKMQYDKIFSFIESGKQEGAKAILGGEKRPGKGYFVDPTSKPHPSRNIHFAIAYKAPVARSFRRRDPRHENRAFHWLCFVV